MPSSRKQSLPHQIFTQNFVSVLDFPSSITHPPHLMFLALNTHIISLPRGGQTVQPVPVYRMVRNSSTTSPQHNSLLKKKKSRQYCTAPVLCRLNFKKHVIAKWYKLSNLKIRCNCAAPHSLEHALTCWHRPLSQMLELLPRDLW
jgi:hypothetical protein